MDKRSASSRASSTRRSTRASSVSKSRASSRKGSAAGNPGRKSEPVETPIEQLPKWIQRRFELSAAALKDLAKRRGKSLRSTKDLDMEGL